MVYGLTGVLIVVPSSIAEMGLLNLAMRVRDRYLRDASADGEDAVGEP
jgi:hypothetical protein